VPTLEYLQESLSESISRDVDFRLRIFKGYDQGLKALVQGDSVEDQQPAVSVTMPELSVLVVDDNPVNRKVLESMVTRLGHRFSMAEDGLVAVGIFASQSFDLVLMDYHMPNMGGPEAARAMLAHSLRAAQVHPPVIAVSAAVSFTERQACADAGMDDIPTKPFRIDELRHMLEERFGKPSQQARAA
jgi:CheY-like chemotaxis protein